MDAELLLEGRLALFGVLTTLSLPLFARCSVGFLLRLPADMRSTLRTFFDTRMRIAPAAEILFLHRNTLINRLERIQDVLGHRVDERSAETQAALVLAELFTRHPDDPATRRDEHGA